MLKKSAKKIAAPQAPKIIKKLVKHSDTRIDPYFWLKDPKNRKVINHLKAENVHADKILKSGKKLSAKIFNEMKNRLKESDETIPVNLGMMSYKTKTIKGKEYVQHILIDNKTKKETIVLDENKMSRGHKYFDLVGPEVSFDGKYIIYGIDTNGSELYSLFIREIKTLKDLPFKIEKTSGEFEWGKNNEIFYLMPDKKQRPSKLYKLYPFEMKKAELVFEDKDDQYWVSINTSMTEEFLFICCGAIETTEILYLDLNKKDAKPKVFKKRKKGVEYTIDHALLGYESYFVISTNENAIDYKIDLYNLKTKKTKNLVPHRPGVMIEDFLTLKNFLVLETRSAAQSNVELVSWGSGKISAIKFKEPVREVGISEHNVLYTTDKLRLSFSSLKVPHTLLEYTFKTKRMRTLKVQELKKFNSSDYVSERVFAKSIDGVMIPISLVYKKGLKKNGNNPCYLYGYGSYGSPTTTSFKTSILPLLERGFIFAIAHIRGSSDCGKNWYYDGKFLKKKNTFHDFIACAEHLIAEKYTAKNLMSAMGGSAGGLLMGAIINMRPDLFLTVTASVPFVDVLTTMLDDSLMLTKIEYDEWGNPNDKKYYDYMKSYSPYDNIGAFHYPHLFVRTGLNDQRVTYWEPAKWVQKLRDFKEDDHDLVFKVNMGAGHFGDTGRYESLKEYAEEYAFILERTQQELRKIK